jgi:hypothetical protein
MARTQTVTVSEDLTALAAHITRKIEEYAAGEDLTPSAAWSRVAAELLNLDLESIEFFDNRDAGIDFCIREDKSFQIYQAKMHELSEMGEPQLDISFDGSGFIDLERAANFLLGEITPENVDRRLLSYRAQLREEIAASVAVRSGPDDIPEISITFALITLGNNLAPAARTQERQLRSTLRRFQDDRSVLVTRYEHIGFTELGKYYEGFIIQPRAPDPITLTFATSNFHFQDPKDARVSHNNFITFYCPATDLVNAARAEGVSLFDANVRYELSKSLVNEEIRTSASHPRTMRSFHLYNNGVTITAGSWSYRRNGAAVEVREPAIINGCQTVRALMKVQDELERQREERRDLIETFEDSCCVLVRLIRRQNVDQDLVVRAANTQNTMEPRNLLSNRSEQRAFEKEFEGYGWFYERKDGALDALKETHRSSLGAPLRTFQIERTGRGPRQIRSCDNREVARRWLSFIGFADEGKNQRRAHFPADGKGLYTKIFRQSPSQHKDVGDQGRGGGMRDGRPPTAWMLYAYHVFEIIRYLLPIATRLRVRVRSELLSEGLPVTLATINDRILAEDEYRWQFALSMLDHVLLELVGFTFARALGENWLAPVPADRALHTGVVQTYNETAAIPEVLCQEGILSLDYSDIVGDPALIAIRLAVQGIVSGLARPEYKDSFVAAERKSRYVESEQLVRAYLRTINQYDNYIREGNLVEWWRGNGSPTAEMSRLLLG